MTQQTDRHDDTTRARPDAAGSVMIITGAGSGIGRATAIAGVAAGFRVALLGRHRTTLTATAELAGGETLVLPADISRPADVDAAFAAVVAAWGRVDVLYNNAGQFGPAGDVDTIAIDDWLASVATNLTGTFLCSRAAFGQMKTQRPQGGRIINNGSISAHVPRPGSAAYTATKHAVTGLTKTLSLDGRPYNIACGQIDIGNAATDLTAGIGTATRQADGSLRAEPTFDVRYAADAVVRMALLPLEVNVQTMTIMATMMPYVGRG